MQQDWNGLQMTCFQLPWTKKSPIGKEVNWVREEGPHDPKEALNNHFRVNNPPIAVSLFAYRSKSGFTPLTRPRFLKVLDTAIDTARLISLKGHGIHIGAMLEYLA